MILAAARYFPRGLAKAGNRVHGLGRVFLSRLETVCLYTRMGPEEGVGIEDSKRERGQERRQRGVHAGF